MNELKTTIHTYYFDTRNPEEKKAYTELKARLTSQGLKCFETWGGSGSHYNPKHNGLVVTLESKHLFSNQWNTAPIEGISEKGLRVFDWAQDYPINFSKAVKKGHYLEQTPAMAEVRRNTVGCGYCGKQESAAKGYSFCPHCLDSEYLAESELHLLRMMPIAGDPKRAPLTEAEANHLLPLYREAQLHGATEQGKARITKQRADIVAECNKTTLNATRKRDGLLWLLDCGIKIDNVIYYDHKGIFSFGWRTVLSKGQAVDLREALKGFPFEHEIKEAIAA